MSEIDDINWGASHDSSSNNNNNNFNSNLPPSLDSSSSSPLSSLPPSNSSNNNNSNSQPSSTPSNNPTDDSNEELEAMKRKVKEMHDEAERLEAIQKQVEEQMTGSSSPSGGSYASRNSQEADKRSIYVGNVDYGATPEELQTHFQSCGTINRVTILCDKMTGHPKGFAYIEFLEEESIANAIVLNEELFRSRPLKILPKRTNFPGAGRGYGGFGRGGGRGAYGMGGGGFRGGGGGAGSGSGGRPFRGRPRRPYYFHPYYS